MVGPLNRSAISFAGVPSRASFAKRFFARVRIDGAVRGEGQGRSKKQAEQSAARDAWERLLINDRVPTDPEVEHA